MLEELFLILTGCNSGPESNFTTSLKCDKQRTGFDNDEWFYKCLYPNVEDIGHEYNGTKMLDDCSTNAFGHCWVSINTTKGEV